MEGAGTRLPAAKVEMLRWPADVARRDELAERGLPRLLLVAEGVAPPRLGRDEDWIRLPADERDVWTRLQQLAERHDERRRRPRLIDGIVLEYGGRTTVQAKGDAALLGLLVGRFVHLAPGDELWPDGGGTRKLAIARASRLRTRLAPAGLAVHTVRSRGVLLDHVGHGGPAGVAVPRDDPGST